MGTRKPKRNNLRVYSRDPRNDAGDAALGRMKSSVRDGGIETGIAAARAAQVPCANAAPDPTLSAAPDIRATVVDERDPAGQSRSSCFSKGGDSYAQADYGDRGSEQLSDGVCDDAHS